MIAIVLAAAAMMTVPGLKPFEPPGRLTVYNFIVHPPDGPAPTTYRTALGVKTIPDALECRMVTPAGTRFAQKLCAYRSTWKDIGDQAADYVRYFQMRADQYAVGH